MSEQAELAMMMRMSAVDNARKMQRDERKRGGSTKIDLSMSYSEQCAIQFSLCLKKHIFESGLCKGANVVRPHNVAPKLQSATGSR